MGREKSERFLSVKQEVKEAVTEAGGSEALL
jgi:hypothetical protein